MYANQLGQPKTRFSRGGDDVQMSNSLEEVKENSSTQGVKQIAEMMNFKMKFNI